MWEGLVCMKIQIIDFKFLFIYTITTKVDLIL